MNRPLEAGVITRLDLESALDRLDRYDTLLLCLYGLGLTQAEIGAATDTNARTISSQLARAKEKLWELWDEIY